MRTAQCARLAVLLKRKMEIEEKMVASIRVLRKAYDQASKEMLVVVKGRFDELNGEGDSGGG